MTEEEKRELVGHVAANYGIRLDPNDPSLLVVDMCARVLDARLEQVRQQGVRTAASGAEFAEVIREAYAREILPRLQAVVASEVRAALRQAVRPPWWTHPALLAPGGALLGAALGFALRSLA